MRKTVTVTVKLPATLAGRVASLARRKGTTRSDVVRDAVAAYTEPRASSVLDPVRHLIGVGKGPGDLSTNPKYLRGYGK